MEGSAKDKKNEMVVEMIRRYSPTVHKCPYKPQEVFVLEDFLVSKDLLPISIPYGEYRLDLDYMADEQGRRKYAFIQSFFIVKGT